MTHRRNLLKAGTSTLIGGTPSGVGFARKLQDFLRDGDVLETGIAGVGVIRNTIRAKV